MIYYFLFLSEGLQVIQQFTSWWTVGLRSLMVQSSIRVISSRIAWRRVHRWIQPYTNTLKQFMRMDSTCKAIFTSICDENLQAQMEEVQKHKPSSPYLLSFLCLLCTGVFLLLDLSRSCWHSCRAVRMDSPSDGLHLYVAEYLVKRKKPKPGVCHRGVHIPV